MLLQEKGDLVSDERQLASIMNKFFINITKTLNLKEDQGSHFVTLEDILKNIIFHLSIDKITKTYESNKKFSFQQVTEKHVPVGDIPADMLNLTLDTHLLVITKIIDLSFENECFPDDLELAKVSPVFKKNDYLDKENYRPVSILFMVSKAFERIIYSQIDAFIQEKLSNLLTGFRKKQDAQHCLMYML